MSVAHPLTLDPVDHRRFRVTIQAPSLRGTEVTKLQDVIAGG
jgi:hypothetical protein